MTTTEQRRTNWDYEPASEVEINLLIAMLRDRDWTSDTNMSNRRWVIECFENGLENLSRSDVTDLANYMRRFGRHRHTPPERTEHLARVFGRPKRR